MPRTGSPTFKTIQIRPVHSPTANPITRFFYWVSKTDPVIVSVCSWWTRQTQAAFGFFVVFTALLAGASSHYTLSTLNVGGGWAMGFGALYSAFIFCLDREIVGGLDRTAAFLRPVLSLFIGVLVAVPVELWIFHDRVDQEIRRVSQADNKDEIAKRDERRRSVEHEREALKRRYQDLLSQEKEWGSIMDHELTGRSTAGRTGLAGEGPVYRNAAAQQQRVRQLLASNQRELESFEVQAHTRLSQIERDFQEAAIPERSSFVIRYEALHRAVQNSSPLYWMSWGITLFFILIEMTPALMKGFTPKTDYQHIVAAEMKENIARIDELAQANLEMAIANPESPTPSIVEKYFVVRFSRHGDV